MFNKLHYYLRYILTAAHCFVGWDESPSTYEVIVGAYHKNQARENQATYYLESVSFDKNEKIYIFLFKNQDNNQQNFRSLVTTLTECLADRSFTIFAC